MTGTHTLDDLLKLVRSKSKRNHQKRHSVNGERSREARARYLLGEKRAERNLALARTYHAQVKAYWSGEREGHPVPLVYERDPDAVIGKDRRRRKRHK